MPAGVFSILPDNFFSPLASPNRQHYAALLVLYYRLFQENPRLERELVVREFMKYLVLHRESLAEETEDAASEDAQEFFLKADPDERSLASRFLKRLINAGWLSEEILADFTKVINITAWGKPFMKALADIDGGLKTEYESHVVTVYSMLCGDTIKNDGHHAVLKAHDEASSLIDSLKVLSQSIKGYYENLNAEAIRSKAALALHEHYDLYMGEVLDKAYKRLKTSDNVSRYRQRIFKQIAELLRNNEWLDASAAKYMRILQTSREECRKKLEIMLTEIRDDLKSVDPLEDEIDRRNAAYSRSSTEIIKAYIEPDSTVAGKIGLLIKAIHDNDILYGVPSDGSPSDGAPSNGDKVRLNISHNIHRFVFLSPSTLAFRRLREEGDFSAAPSKTDFEALDKRENEFLEQMRQRLSLKKINVWLDEQGGKDRVLVPAELINDEASYIRFVYALLYGASRNNFGYRIEEDDEKAEVRTANYVVPDVRFRHELAHELAKEEI